MLTSKTALGMVLALMVTGGALVPVYTSAQPLGIDPARPDYS